LQFNHEIKAMKNLTANKWALVLTGLCLPLVLPLNRAVAQVYTWDPQGSGAYSGTMSGNWEDLAWASGDGATSATPGGWLSGAAAELGPNTAIYPTAYSLSMNANETVGGIFNGLLNNYSCNVTIGGPGQMILPSGEDGFGSYNSSGNSDDAVTTINNVISGAGTITLENYGGGGQFSLNGINTFTGGTELGYSGAGWNGIVNFNNNSSFGTGTINLISGSGSALVAEGTSALNIGNNVTISQAGARLNIVGNGNGVKFSGGWSLGGNAFTLGSGGSGTNKVEISGVISGTGGSLEKSGAGRLILSAINTYTGPTTVSLGVLQLNQAGAISNSSSVIMNGGTLDFGGLNQLMTGSTLGLATNSILDFGAGATSVAFAKSSGQTWNGVLDLLNWNSVMDQLRIGTDASGLTSTQLDDIEFNGNAATLGTAGLDPNGYIVAVPEPSVSALGLLGGLGCLGLMWKARRRNH
jgi:autotransporter-associated beta strand protein